MDHDERRSDSGPGPSRSSSIKGFGIGKPSFSFGKKKKDDARTASTVSVPSQSGDSERGSIADSSTSSSHTHVQAAAGIPGSPSLGGWKHVHGPGPTPAQAAYIQRILANQGGSEPVDPLAKLRAANGGEGLAVNTAGHPASGEYGLIDCLKQFTSVEVLEGDNSFACKKCWRIKTGKYQGMEPALREEDEDAEHVHGYGYGRADGSVPTSPVVSSQRRATAPSISIMSDTSSESMGQDDRPSLRHPSVTSNSHSAHIRAPSPLRRQFQDAPPIPSDAISLSSSQHTGGGLADISSGETETELEQDVDGADAGDGTDGLSDTSEESDVGVSQPAEIPVGRPKMAPRKKSTHFVHRRAFKRYLIAKSPEVLVFHLKRFRQTQKTSMTFTSFYDLKKWVSE